MKRDEELWKTLVAACPANRRTGEKSVRELARRLRVSHQTVYYWTTQGRLPADKAVAIARLGEVKLRGLERWVYGQDVSGL